MEQKTTLVDRIYLSLKNSISNKELSPGQKINIKELARQYGVSDTPVKQALNRLISDNLVESIPNKGMNVRSVTIDEMNEIFDIRCMMDLHFMKDVMSTVNYNDTLKQQLLDNLEQQKHFLENHNSVETGSIFYDIDDLFHELYLRGSGNNKVLQIFQNLNPFMFYSNFSFFQQPPSRDRECVEEHTAIVDALLAQDEKALEQAILTHNANSRKMIYLIFKTNQMI